MAHGSFYIFFLSLLAAFFIQIGTNLLNDAYDFKKGADQADRLGPLRVTQAGLLTSQQVLLAGAFCFVLALAIGSPLIVRGGISMVLVAVSSVLFGFLYTGGPYPLAYIGLGEVFVLLFFGWVSTCSVYYLQTGEVSRVSFLVGTQVGLLATVLIALNNLRDVVQDARAGKRTLAVRFGRRFSKGMILFCLFTPYILCLFSTFLPLLTLPLAVFISYKMEKAFAMAALLHLLFGFTLALGFIL